MEQEEKLKKVKCDLCEEENYIGIKIEIGSDSAFCSPRSICCKCFKGGDLDEKIFLRNKKFCEEQIEMAEERKSYWQEELLELKQQNK